VALIQRLDRLERAQRIIHGARPCDVCGHSPRAPVDMRVVFDGDEEELGPDRCPACGTVRVLQITFDDRG
jgi:hypothetical protein